MSDIIFTFTSGVKEQDGRWYPIVWEQMGDIAPRTGTLYEIPLHSEEAARHMAQALTIETRIMREQEVESWMTKIKERFGKQP